jgi:hypothetical protein
MTGWRWGLAARALAVFRQPVGKNKVTAEDRVFPREVTKLWNTGEGWRDLQPGPRTGGHAPSTTELSLIENVDENVDEDDYVF